MLQNKLHFSVAHFTVPFRATPRGGGGVSCRLVLRILTLFQTKKCHFSHPFSDLASKIHTCFQTWGWSQNTTYVFTSTEIMSSLLRLERQQKYFFLSYSFIIKTTNTFIHYRNFLGKPYPIPHQNGQNLYPFSGQNGAKTIPFGAAHTCMAYIREYRPPWGTTATMCNTR